MHNNANWRGSQQSLNAKSTQMEDRIALCTLLRSQTIFFEDLIEESKKDKALDLVAVAVKMLSARISCLQVMMNTGRVTLEVRIM